MIRNVCARSTALTAAALSLALLSMPALATAEGCGRISTSMKPPLSQSLYPLILHEVDGGLAGPVGNEVLRLTPGKHVLKVSEAIDGRRFTGFENLRRTQLFRYEQFKYLHVDIQADTTYRLGVRFFKDKRQPIREQAYWEPVIWSEVAEACR